MTFFSIRERNSDLVIAQSEAVRELEGNWYFQPEAVDVQYLQVTQRIYTCPYKGRCYWIDLVTPNGRASNVAWTYFDLKPGYEFLQGEIGFYSHDTAGTLAVVSAGRDAA